VHYPEELHEKSPENSPEIIQNESISTQNTSYEESSSATPETIDLSALQEENSDSNEDTVRDFFNNPKSSDSNFTRNLRNTFYNLQENANKLKERVESLEKLNDEYKQANDRLQYWLTSVESENESIADFIELYRTQRAQMKTKMEEKENECNELRKTRELLEVCFMGYMRNSLRDEIFLFIKNESKF
jgi:chromosome segregation ATPase